jgi:putative tryptophan/tyrosine transport system substrate-binding protein
MRRRNFISLVGGVAIGWPPLARAQQNSMPLVGFLASYSLDRSGQHLAAAFLEGLKEFGYEDGRNVRVEYVSVEGDYDRLPTLASELVRDRVDVIAAVGGSPAVLAAMHATSSISIVFVVGVDPVKLGLVASLNRPGGNVTGVVNLAVELGPKRLELIRELLPTAARIAVLINPHSPVADAAEQEMQAASRTLGVQIGVLHASTDRELETVFAGLNAAGLVVIGDPFFNSRGEKLGALASRYDIPAIFQFGEFTAGGGLMSYGSSQSNMHRLAGIYTGRVLKGEVPANLPVQRATELELIVNLKVADKLRIAVPATLIARANEVIQ